MRSGTARTRRTISSIVSTSLNAGMTTDTSGLAMAPTMRVISVSSGSVTVRMQAVPLPRRAHDGVEIGVLRLPVQLGLGFVRGGKQDRRIARPAGRERPRDRPAGDPADSVDHLPHRVRPAG